MSNEERQDSLFVGYLEDSFIKGIPSHNSCIHFKKMFEERQDKKLVGCLAAPLPPMRGTPSYDSYMHFKKMFTDECKTTNIPSWRKIKGGHVE